MVNNQKIQFFTVFIYFLKINYFFLEREEGREKEREKNINVWLPPTHPLLATQACALTGNQTGDPLVRRPTLSPLSHTSQGFSIYFNQI